MKKTIFLIGYKGSGKSRIGRELSEVISYNFYDLDNLLSGFQISDLIVRIVK